MNNKGLVKKILAGIIAGSSMMFAVACTKNNIDNNVSADSNPIITDLGVPNGNATSATIGTGGGTIASADGRLTINIPQGALATNTTISIQPISNKGPLGLGSAYRLSPEGLHFKKPVKLIFHYDQQLLAGVPDDFLWIITQTENGSWAAVMKSVIDKATKTVTIYTTHFSDWSLGKFIDLSLTPSSKTLKKGESVQLQVTGFASGNATEEDELVPLVPIKSTDDILRPLTPIPATEARLIEFRIKGWSLNGQFAPLSGKNGSLNASGFSATYKAPNVKPSVNPVAVSVSLESKNKQGEKSSYLLTSNISIVDADLYLLVKVDGVTYEYYQYGFNGSIPPDPNDVTIANCGIEDNILSIAGTRVVNNSNLKNSFALSVKNPSQGTIQLNCLFGNGEDEASFMLEGHQDPFNIFQIIRTPNGAENCDVESKCANISITFTDYQNELMGRVAGFFSGVLYEDKDGFSENCQNPIAHTIEGEFWLTRAN